MGPRTSNSAGRVDWADDLNKKFAEASATNKHRPSRNDRVNLFIVFSPCLGARATRPQAFASVSPAGKMPALTGSYLSVKHLHGDRARDRVDREAHQVGDGSGARQQVA